MAKSEYSIDEIEVDGEMYKVKVTKVVESERLDLYSKAFPDAGLDGTEGKVLSCTIEREGSLVDHIVKVNRENNTVFMTECKISYDDVSPTELVEYQFDEDGPWFLAHVSLPSLEFYRQSKYKIWKDMLLKPTCEAALKRMLATGIITTLFDDNIFITPESDIKSYQVDDGHGKQVRIPHPVHALRVWNSEKGYTPVSAFLEGAPKKDGEDAAWCEILKTLNEEHGQEYIAKLME